MDNSKAGGRVLPKGMQSSCLLSTETAAWAHWFSVSLSVNTSSHLAWVMKNWATLNEGVVVVGKKKPIHTHTSFCALHWRVTAASLGNLILIRLFTEGKKRIIKINIIKVGGQSDTLTFYQDFPQKSFGSHIFALSRLPENSRALLLLPLMGCSATAPCSMSLWILGVCDMEAHTSHSE